MTNNVTNNVSKLIKKFTGSKSYEDQNKMELPIENMQIALKQNVQKVVSHNTEPFSCLLCDKIIAIDCGIVLVNCKDPLCRDCMIGTLREQTDVNTMGKCPICMVEMAGYEIKLIAGQEIIDLFGLKRHENTIQTMKKENDIPMQCNNYDCRHTFIVPSSFNGQLICEECKVENCFKCKAIHQYHTCDQFQKIENGENFDHIEENPMNQTFDLELSSQSTEYEELKRLDDLNLNENQAVINCSTCFVDIIPKEGAILKECLHSFCKQCLENAIQKSQEFRVKCPSKKVNCSHEILDREIKCVLGAKKYAGFQKKHMKKIEIPCQHCGAPIPDANIKHKWAKCKSCNEKTYI